jgi:hypothetical protein
MKIIVCQFYTPNVSYGAYTEKINSHYCELNGYDYYVEKNEDEIKEKLEGRSPTWYKPHLIKKVLKNNPDTDYVLFIDIDAIFTNFDRRIEEFITDDFSIMMTKDYGPSLVNAGVMLLKNNQFSNNFISQWWDICEEYPEYKTGLWHDQTCIGLLHKRIDQNQFKIIEPTDFNSRNYDPKRFIFHAFSFGMHPNRTIDQIHNQIFNIQPEENVTLHDLGSFYNTDKSYLHNYYNRFYEQLFKPYKQKADILEIGVLDGGSLKVWEKYFREGKIHGIDLKVNEELHTDRVTTFKVDQSSIDELNEFASKSEKYDIIVDDGSHKMMDQQITFQIFFDLVKSGGLFVIEDLQTSLECRMPSKAVFGWGDPEKTTTLEFLENLKNSKLETDYKIEGYDSILNDIESIEVSTDREDSIYAIIKKK